MGIIKKHKKRLRTASNVFVTIVQVVLVVSFVFAVGWYLRRFGIWLIDQPSEYIRGYTCRNGTEWGSCLTTGSQLRFLFGVIVWLAGWAILVASPLVLLFGLSIVRDTIPSTKSLNIVVRSDLFKREGESARYIGGVIHKLGYSPFTRDKEIESFILSKDFISVQRTPDIFDASPLPFLYDQVVSLRQVSDWFYEINMINANNKSRAYHKSK